MNSFMKIITSTYLLVFVPIVLLFIYNVVRDPAFPLLVKATWKACQARFNSYLGATGTVHDSSTRKQQQTGTAETPPLRRRVRQA